MGLRRWDLSTWTLQDAGDVVTATPPVPGIRSYVVAHERGPGPAGFSLREGREEGPV